MGVVKTKSGKTFVLADLPGLIEGASKGEGLGDRFLKHIERTRVILHVIDMAGIEERDPYEDYQLINKELENFNPKLLERPMVILANKMDIEGAKKHLEDFKKKVKDKKIFAISAFNNEGLNEVMEYLADLLDTVKENELYEDDLYESHILYKFQEEKPYTILKEGDEFVIRGEKIEKLFKMTKFTDEGARRFSRKLLKMGIDDDLAAMGAKDGDKVRILDFYFEYHE